MYKVHCHQLPTIKRFFSSVSGEIARFVNHDSLRFLIAPDSCTGLHLRKELVGRHSRQISFACGLRHSEITCTGAS